MYTLKSLPEFDQWLNSLSDRLVYSTVLKRLKRTQQADIARAKALCASIDSD